MISHRHNQGVVLIYALLVIGLLTAIALTVSIVIINELRLTSSSTDGTLAYYALPAFHYSFFAFHFPILPIA